MLLFIFTTDIFSQETETSLAVFYLVGDKPPEKNKFKFLWNSKGEIGKSENYTPLTFSSGRYSAKDENGNELFIDRFSWRLAGSAEKDTKKIARHLIATYTMKEDSTGNVWLTDGNFRQLTYNRKTQEYALNLKVYVNDTERDQIVSTMTNYPTLFNMNLGRLRKGDTISIAVGPGKNANNIETAYLYFKLKDIHDISETPSEPLNEMMPYADKPAPRFDYSSGKVANGFENVVKIHNKRLLDNKPDLIIMGDSLTNFWENEGKIPWKEKFSPHKKVLMGNAGDATYHLLWRLQNSCLDKTSPKLIIILIGSNNLTSGYSNDEIIAGNAAVIHLVKEKAPTSKILLLGLFPRNGLNNRIKAINPELAKLAASENIMFLDLQNIFINEDGSLKQNLYTDGTHLSTEGYNKYADALIPVIKTILD